MRDVLQAATAWLEQGKAVALAVVVDVAGSAPRPVGTAMAIDADGSMAGNVSAGCVESAVVAEAREALVLGAPRRRTYGTTDEQALSVGLMCGGEVDVFILPLAAAAYEVLRHVQTVAAERQPVALGMVVDGAGPHGALIAVEPGSTTGSLGSDALDAAVASDALALLAQGATRMRRYDGCEDGREDVGVLVISLAPPPRMLVFGASDVGAALAHIGGFLNYRVTVCDARAAFGTRERFPHSDDVVVEWPHRYLERVGVDERTAVCVLTHDPKFDVPLLAAALRTPAGYIGMMGSRRTQEDRRSRLVDLGVSEDAIARVRAPIGLDLGARTPEEMAVSIAAEMIALNRGGTGRPLRDIDGAIHRAART